MRWSPPRVASTCQYAKFLPPNWKEHFCDEHGIAYYWNKQHEEDEEEEPPEEPAAASELGPASSAACIPQWFHITASTGAVRNSAREGLAAAAADSASTSSVPESSGLADGRPDPLLMVREGIPCT